MKKIFITGICFLLGYSLWAQQQELKTKYVIHGKLTGDYQGKVYLVSEDGIGGNQTVIDSCEVIRGEYRFEGKNVETSTMHYIVSRNGNYTPFFLENGDIHIKGNVNNFYGAEIRGTINNEILRLYNLHLKFVQDSIFACATIDGLRGKTKDAVNQEIAYKRHAELNRRRCVSIEKELIRQYSDQVFAPLMLMHDVIYQVPLDELKKLRSQLSPKLADHPYVKALDELIEVQDFKVGCQAYSFRIPGLDGKELCLENFRGKYVLLDFWASWCGPCRRIMPEVVKLYKEYKGKNFEIIGISLDNKSDAWKKAVKEMNMSWPQGSDFGGWNSEVARRYNVHAIPATVLLNPDGKVEALNLRGEALEAKVKEVLSRKH